MSQEKNVSAYVIATMADAEDKIFMVRLGYNNNKWSLPGGAVERGELIIDAAVREFSEETGHNVILDKDFSAHFSLRKSYGFTHLFRGRVNKIVDSHLCSPVDPGEISEIRLCSARDLQHLKAEIYPAQWGLLDFFINEEKRALRGTFFGWAIPPIHLNN